MFINSLSFKYLDYICEPYMSIWSVTVLQRHRYGAFLKRKPFRRAFMKEEE